MPNIHDRPQLIVICYVFSSTPFIFGQLVYVLGGKTLQDWWEKLTNPLKFYIFELNTSAACIHFLLRKIPHRISQKLEPFFWLMTLNSLVNPLIYLGKSFSKKMSSGIFETHLRAADKYDSYLPRPLPHNMAKVTISGLPSNPLKSFLTAPRLQLAWVGEVEEILEKRERCWLPGNWACSPLNTFV